MEKQPIKHKASGGITIHHFIHEQPPKYALFYNSMKKITSANFGDVFMCNHIPTSSLRCIKVYQKEKLKNINQNTFEEEIQLLTRLDHPNIMKIYEYFQDEANFYLVTEYLSGGELFDFIIKYRNFDEETVCKIMGQIMGAVNYLHRNNILHRDLKPENVMLAIGGDINSIKIIDFGTSKIFKKDDKLTAPIGTCFYMAPEMLKRSYNELIDIWACGVIAYILLVGYPPFNGHNDHEIFTNIVQKPVIFDRDDWRNITPGAINLIMRMLEKNPEERISLDHIFQHNWFKRNFKTLKLDHTIVLKRLKGFTQLSKLENAVRMYIVQFYDIEKDKERLTEFFIEADVNHDGMLDKRELTSICKKVGIGLDIDEFISLADVNLDGNINYSEFLMTAVNFKTQTNIKLLKEIFDAIDLDHSGFISKVEMARFINVGEEEDITSEMFKEADKDNNGKITFEEFLASLINIYKP